MSNQDNILNGVNALEEDVLTNVSGGKMQAESLEMTDKKKKGLKFGNTLHSGGKVKAEGLIYKETTTEVKDSFIDTIDVDKPRLC